MKKTLLFIALCSLIITSCTQGNGDTATLQKKVDSLTALVSSKGQKKSTATVKQGRALFTKKQMNFSNGDPIDTFLTPWAYSGWSAHRWDRVLTDKGYRDMVMKSPQSCYFVLPASNMQYLTDQMGMQYIAVYLTIDTNYQLTLMYVGANASADAQNDTIYEQPIMGTDGGQYMLNHVWPCPQCAVDGLNTHENNNQ